jgi:hypothetical protein
MTVASWCVSRATFTTLNPKDKVYSEVIEKFKRQVFINNVMRIKAVILGRTQRDMHCKHFSISLFPKKILPRLTSDIS